LRTIATELDVSAEHVLQIGTPARQLLEVARIEHAVMLVLGSRPGAPRPGRVVRSVVARPPCPVVVLRRGTPEGDRARLAAHY
jgi:nucleotide-binding universal stress UspA family protein